MKNKELVPYISAIGFSSIFGLSFVFTKLGLTYMSTIELIAFRFMLAALVLEILRIFKIIEIDFKGKDMKPVILTAIFQPVLYFYFEVEGVNLTSASEGGLMIALIPVMVAIAARIFLKERLKLVQVLFIILSIAGVLVVNFAKSGIEASGSTLGYILLFLAVLSAAFYNIGSKTASKSFKPIEITYVMMWLGAIAFNLFNIAIHIQSGRLSEYFQPLTTLQAIIPIAYLGILSSVVAFFLVNFTISRIPVSQSSVFANLSTIVAIIAGVVILNESFGAFDVLGAAMILIGVWGTVRFGQKPLNKKHV